MAKNRFYIWGISEKGYEYEAGNQRGYATVKDAFDAAERLVKKSGLVHGVGEFEILDTNERDCIEVLGYEHPHTE